MRILFISLKKLFCFLPRRLSYVLVSFCAVAGYIFLNRQRNSVKRNIRHILKTEDRRIISRTSRKMFVNFAKYLVDFFSAEKLTRSISSGLFDLREMEKIDSVVSSGNGVIILTAHLGNWELGGGVVSLHGHTVHAVALPHADPAVNEIFDNQRVNMNMSVISTGAALKKCYSVLKQGKILALLGDRDFSGMGSRATMFSADVSVPRGPAVLSAKFKVPILPAFLLRTSGDRYRLCVDAPVYPVDDSGQLKSQEEIMQEYLSVIQRYLRDYPDQWYIFDDYFNI